MGIGASPTGRRGNSEAAGALWRCVDAALADAAAALRSSLDARATAARKSAAAAAAASADSQPSEKEQLDDAMGQHWDLSDDIGKVLAFHLSHAPDTASAARRQMSTGAVRDACRACAGGLGAPAAESLWRCVTLAAGAHDLQRLSETHAAVPCALPRRCSYPTAVTHFAWTRLSCHHAVPVAGVGLASHMPLISILREVANVAQTRVVDNHTAPIRTSVLYSTKSEDGFALLPSMRAVLRHISQIVVILVVMLYPASHLVMMRCDAITSHLERRHGIARNASRPSVATSPTSL